MEMVKKTKLGSVLGNFARMGPSSTAKCEIDVKETLSSEHFALAKVVRHGFPHEPRCMAYDPVQKLLAIGNQSGAIRIFGRPGVECLLQHESTQAVIQLQFLVNEGALVSACKDDCVHLWNFRQKKPEIVQSLQFQKEKVTCVHLPFQSKWLYVGTDRGNVQVVSIALFTLSGYVIHWNKAIDISQKNHPGAVKHLSDCPSDDAKLLIGFEKGNVVLWDLKNREADARFNCEQGVRSISWHYEGRQFLCSHGDGSLSIWQVKKPQEPFQCWAPHSRGCGGSRTSSPQDNSGDNSKQRERCRAIAQVEWKHGRGPEEFLIFSGGLPMDESGVLPAVTVLRGGKSATVLEMEHQIVSFLTLCASPHPQDVQEPFAVAVLLKNDFLIVDLSVPGYPCFENPYPMDVHETAVTCCAYLADCPTDLIAAYYSVGSKQKRQGCSDKPWPITGGEWGSSATGNPEIIITGHADGSLKFWDASSENLQVLYKLKTGRHFERPDESLHRDFEALAVEKVFLCPESRCLAVAGRAAQVTLFRFLRTEASSEVPVLEVPIMYNTGEEVLEGSNDAKHSAQKSGELERQNSVCSIGSHSSATSEGRSLFYPMKVRGGPQKRPAGYQPDCVCLTGWMSSSTPEQVTALEINSAYGLLVYGTGQGIAIVDIVQHVNVLTMGTPDLYGPSDPFRRTPRNQLNSMGNGGEKQSSSDPEPSPLSPTTNQTGNEPEAQRDRSDTIQLPSEEELSEMFKRCPSDAKDLAQRSNENPLVVCSGNEDTESRTSVEEALEAVEDADNLILIEKSQSDLSGLGKEHCPSAKDKRNAVTTWLKTAGKPDGSSVKAMSVEGSSIPRKVPATRLRSAPLTGESVSLGTSPNTLNPQSGYERTDSVLSKASTTSEVDPVDLIPRRPREGSDSTATEPGSPSPVPPPRRQKKWDKPGNCSFTADVKRSQSERVPKMKDEKQESLIKGLARRISSRHQHRHQKKQHRSPSTHKEKDVGRSRSSSVSSDTTIVSEGITLARFIESCIRKSDSVEVPSLWVGTTQGSLLALSLSLPAESRLEEPVFASPAGFRLKCKGKLLAARFSDQNFNLLAPPVESWKETKDSDRAPKNRVVSRARFSPDSSLENSSSGTDQQYVVMASERSVKVVGVPSQNTVFKQRLETQLLRVGIVTLQNAPIILACSMNGRIMSFSLPSLRTLLDSAFLPQNDTLAGRTLCFSEHGNNIYMCSPSEIQKFTVSSEMAGQLSEVLGDLFQGIEMPEPPKQGFLSNVKGLFGGANPSLDREELFGSSSGKPPNRTAVRIPGPNAIDPLRAQGSSAASEVAKAKMALIERGEKLGEVEERTAMMAEASKAYSDHASELASKYKNKKWYQL